jgi:hypothetical protein
MAKVADTLSFVRKTLEAYRRPAIMCSFGKDSMVLLHILRTAGIHLPVVFHRDPWWPQKYTFADRMIAEWELEVHDYAPSFVTLWEGKEIMAFTNHYQIGPTPSSYLQMPKNILPPEPNRKFLCGIKDVLNRPTGTFNYPFDLVLIGHKSSDKDQIAGAVPLHVDVKNNQGMAPDAAFPLRYWTDEDVWDYTSKHGVPQQEDRYDVANRCEKTDKWTNSDYANVCIACCDKRSQAKSVMCPKLGYEVSCVADKVPYSEPQFDYYGDDN